MLLEQVYRQIEKKSSSKAQEGSKAPPQGTTSSTPYQSAELLFDPLANGVGPPDLGSAPASMSGSPVHGSNLQVHPAAASGRGRSTSSASDSAAGWYIHDGPLDIRYSGFALGQGSFNTAHAAATSRREADLERALVGSLRNSYPFAKDGLCKKTISIQVDGSTQHLISYYKVDDVRNGRLNTPLSLPEIAAINISPMILQKSNFRNPPEIEVMPDGSLRYRGDGSESSRRAAAAGVGFGSEGTSGSEGKGDDRIGPSGARDQSAFISLGLSNMAAEGTHGWYMLPGSDSPLASTTADLASVNAGPPSQTLTSGPSSTLVGGTGSSSGPAYPRRLSGTFIRDRSNRPAVRFEPYTRLHLGGENSSVVSGNDGSAWSGNAVSPASSGASRHRFTFSGRDNVVEYMPPPGVSQIQQSQQQKSSQAPRLAPPQSSHSDTGVFAPEWDSKHRTDSPDSRQHRSLWPTNGESPQPNSLSAGNNASVSMVGNGCLLSDHTTRPRGATTGTWHPSGNDEKMYGMALSLGDHQGGNFDLPLNASSSGLPTMLGSSIEHQQQVASRSVHLTSLVNSTGLPSASPSCKAGGSYCGNHPAQRNVASDPGEPFQHWHPDPSCQQQKQYPTPSNSVDASAFQMREPSIRQGSLQQIRWSQPPAYEGFANTQLQRRTNEAIHRHAQARSREMPAGQMEELHGKHEQFLQRSVHAPCYQQHPQYSLEDPSDATPSGVLMNNGHEREIGHAANHE